MDIGGDGSVKGESESRSRVQQQAKPISFSNGVLKRHQPPAVVSYKECLKNHAAAMGGHALDGCGEFMPSPSANSADPTSLKCAACGCHRNFHSREPEEPPQLTQVIEYQPHHRHHPPPPPRSPNSASPPPISSSYYPSAPHMLLALSGAMVSPRKRFRTKFSQAQKERMYEFAERVEWRMHKKDDDLVHDFCNQIGVDRGVLKVWMHNNKNTLGKRDADGNRTINPEINGHEDNNPNHNTTNIENDNHCAAAGAQAQARAVAHLAAASSSSS